MIYSETHIKVECRLEADSWHGLEIERVWGRKLKLINDKVVVEVDNIPFFSKSFSFMDILLVSSDSQLAHFVSVIDRGGHSTYRVFLKKQDCSTELQELKEAGCDWERSRFGGGELYALDLPPQADINRVYNILEREKAVGTWLFEEGYVEHQMQDGPKALRI